MRPTLLVMCLISGVAFAQSAPSLTSDERFTHFGAVLAPVALPSGGSAAYGYAGVPEIGAGYRQGLGPVELEGRFRFDYYHVAPGLEAVVRVPVYSESGFAFAAQGGLGFIYDFGAMWFSPRNFQATYGRVMLGGIASYRAAETVAVVGNFEIPVDISLSVQGAHRFRPLLGAGAEVYVGSNISLLVLGQIGLDQTREPLGITDRQLGYGARVGFGYRLF
jgi:hypothetical protein